MLLLQENCIVEVLLHLDLVQFDLIINFELVFDTLAICNDDDMIETDMNPFLFLKNEPIFILKNYYWIGMYHRQHIEPEM